MEGEFERRDACTGISGEFQIFDMRFVKACATMLEIVKGREGNADVTNEACLGPDLEEEWGDMSTVRRIPDVGKSKAVVGIEKWACFAIRLLIELEECRTEAVSSGSKQGRRRRAIVCYEDDGFWVNEEFRIDLEPDLLREAEKIHCHSSRIIVGLASRLTVVAPRLHQWMKEWMHGPRLAESPKFG